MTPRYTNQSLILSSDKLLHQIDKFDIWVSAATHSPDLIVVWGDEFDQGDFYDGLKIPQHIHDYCQAYLNLLS